MQILEKISKIKKNLQQQQKRVNAYIKQQQKELLQGKLHRKLQEQFGQSEPYLISVLRSSEKLVIASNYQDELRNFLIKYGIPNFFTYSQQFLQTKCFKLILEIDLVCLKQKKYPTQPPYYKQGFLRQVQEIRSIMLPQALTKVNNLKRSLIKRDSKNQQIQLHQTTEAIKQKQQTKQNCFQKYVGHNRQVVYSVCDKLETGRDFDIYAGYFVKQMAMKVAVKVLKNTFRKLKNQAQYRGNFDLMKRIKHPNIVKFYFQYIDQQNNIYIVTQRCSEKLQDVINCEQELQQSQIFKYSFQIIAAINYLHTFNEKICIIHRDLTPQNILLKGSEIKVSQFGISREIGLEDKNNQTQFTIAGSHYYMAPQLINAQQNEKQTAKYTHKCDIWSIGCIIYEMLTGQRLFQKKVGQQQKQGFQTKIKQMLKGKNKFWEKILIDQILVYEEKYRIDSQSLMENFNMQLRNFIIDQNQKVSLTPLKYGNNNQKKISSNQRQTSQRISLMLDFIYGKIKLTYRILAQIQNKQGIKLYLTEYLSWVLQFILLNWYMLELKNLLLTLTKKSIIFEDKQYIFSRKQANINLMDKRQYLISQIQIEINKRQQLLKQYRQYLQKPKFQLDRNNLKRNNQKIIKSILQYKEISNANIYNQILEQFLRNYGIPMIEEKIQNKTKEQIWRLTASLFLLNKKSVRYPLKRNYQKNRLQQQFSSIKTMNISESKGFINELMNDLQIEKKIKEENSQIGKIVNVIKRLPTAQQIANIYDRASLLIDFKYTKIKIMYNYIYHFQQIFNSQIDSYYYSLLMFLMILWNKMEIMQFFREFSAQTIIFQKIELKMQRMQRNDLFLNKRNTIINEFLNRRQKLNSHMKELVDFIYKPNYSVKNAEVENRHQNLTQLLQKYQTIQVKSNLVKNMFMQCLDEYGINMQRINNLGDKQKLKTYRIIGVLFLLSSMNKQFPNTPPYDKTAITKKFEEIDQMKQLEIYNFFQKYQIR